MMVKTLSSADFKSIYRGLFAVNKIKNKTSVDVLEIVKENILKESVPKIHSNALKVGHGGTLDHTATGVLVIGTGFGCKILPQLLHGSKKYITIGYLGTATDTDNETGTIIKECSYSHITREMLEKELVKFQGNILQTPPFYSALKRNGQRVADLTKSGVAVELSPRPVTCYSVRCINFSPPTFSLEVHCGGGFYIRSLVKDLGTALGSCAHVQELYRFQHGPFTEQDMLEPHEWTLENILVAINEARLKYGEFFKRPRKKLYIKNQ